jgi:FkbM family methyltransferase
VLSKSVAVAGGVSVVVLAAAAYFVAVPFRAQFAANQECCLLPFASNVRVTANELLGRATYSSQIGQDKWVLEKVFPGVTDGYFLDVGSGHGTFHSNTVQLERRGWKGICVDPFPTAMQTRTCQMFKEVVWSVPGKVMTFHMAEGLAGLADTLGRWREEAQKAPSVDLTTVTLDDLLTRAKAPAFIHFMSLDIEGAELDALRAFPFDRIRLGSLAIEHNYEEPKRTEIVELLAKHGYERVHSLWQDDFFVPVTTASR